MKTKLFFVLTFLFALTVFAQQEKKYMLSYGETQIGFYAGVGGRYSTSLNSDPVGFMDIKGAAVFNGKWGVGFMVSGLRYDKGLSKLVNDAPYHLYVSYSGIFVERIFSLNENLKLSLSVASGMGEASYEYDKDYLKEKVWSEEIIDKTEFAFFEPGIEIQHRVTGNWWIGITGSYRNTSPLEMMGTEENLLRKFSGGITFKWGIF